MDLLGGYQLFLPKSLFSLHLAAFLLSQEAGGPQGPTPDARHLDHFICFLGLHFIDLPWLGAGLMLLSRVSIQHDPVPGKDCIRGDGELCITWLYNTRRSKEKLLSNNSENKYSWWWLNTTWSRGARDPDPVAKPVRDSWVLPMTSLEVYTFA